MFPVAQYLEEQKVVRRLQAIYRRIPATAKADKALCQRSGEINLLEFLNIMNHIYSLPNKEEIIYKAIKYELLHLASLDYACPLKTEDGCLAEVNKPLNCRLYGLFPSDESYLMRQALIEKNLEIYQNYLQYGIELPEKTMDFFADPSSEDDAASLLVDERRTFYNLMLELQNELLPEEFIEQLGEHSSMSSYLLRTASDIRTLEKLRVEALKTLLKKKNKKQAESFGAELMPEILETIEAMLFETPGVASLSLV